MHLLGWTAGAWDCSTGLARFHRLVYNSESPWCDFSVSFAYQLASRPFLHSSLLKEFFLDVPITRSGFSICIHHNNSIYLIHLFPSQLSSTHDQSIKMRFAAAALILVSASVAVAQTTSAAAPQPTSSECEAQNIVDACREGIQKQIDGCEGNDFICLCDNYTNLLTCYNNCPNSNERPPVQNQVTQFCLAAAP